MIRTCQQRSHSYIQKVITQPSEVMNFIGVQKLAKKLGDFFFFLFIKKKKGKKQLCGLKDSNRSVLSTNMHSLSRPVT